LYTPELRRRHFSGWRVAFTAGVPTRHHRSGWRWRETFLAAVVANLADPVIRTNNG